MKAATGFEPGTSQYAAQCSTSQLYHFWYKTYIQLALLFDRYIKLNRFYKNKYKTKLKAATGFETGTSWSAAQYSTTELYHFWYSTYIQLALLF